MNLFVDTNVLMTVMLPERKHLDASARVLSLAQDFRHRLFTTAMALGNCFYMLEKRSGYMVAKRKIGILAEHLHIAPCDDAETRKALAEKRVHDFEDGLQYFAALRAGCNHIITYDDAGFYYATIPVLTPEIFLTQYIQQRDK